jgi:TonB family protein
MEPEVFRLEAELQAIENTALRRKLAMQRAIIVSVLLHGMVLALILVFPEAARRPRPDPAARVIEREPPVPIRFVVPTPAEAPPSLPPLPEAEPPAAESVPPRPDIPSPDERYEDVPLRMEPTPKRPEARPESPRADRAAASGLDDDRPRGGESGGPRSEPQPGSPPDGGTARGESDRTSDADPPRDLNARLREFRQALGQALAETRDAPEGSGPGRGGVTMPELPNAGFGVGNLQFESRDYDWGDYGRAIYVAIWRAWYNRLLISAGVFERWSTQNREPNLDHQTVVRFVIERSGEVTEVSVETPSGCYPLDDSAADALRAVILPPLPSDFPREQERVRATFLAQGEVRMLRPNLEWLKSRGYF